MSVVKNLGKNKDQIEITLEDQKQINTFAKRNTTLDELKEEMRKTKESLQNMEDASDELLMIDEPVVSYKVGEVFFQMNCNEVEEHLEETKSALQEEIRSLEEQISDNQGLVSSLKAKLYGKFGNNINLEADE
ncbi:prefoldin subunit 4-like [Xenia sp. Carnegie-2017]|uniref:prefoldin subunit 4-like n=1 Tax=Xenia sp. Carnegie-2017 TaxID=2897299 RepID=UPI001F048DF0|nr:prefoldin subunit 4-like [Xenia sp. Carnegie-2017]